MGRHRRTFPGRRGLRLIVLSAGLAGVAVAAAGVTGGSPASLADSGADASHRTGLGSSATSPIAVLIAHTSTAPTPPAGPCPAGWVALTFDDGPQPGVTDKILADVLRLHVPATFFVEGRYVAAAPRLVDRMAHSPGITLGDHSWDHPDLTGLSRAGIRSELLRTQQAIVDAGAQAPTLMRYPFGAHDARTDRIVLRMGLRPVGWNLATHDPSQTTTAAIEDAAIERIDHSAATGRRHFLTVLMHDGQPNSRLDVPAVAPIVREARQRGFCIVPARAEDPATLRRHDESGATADAGDDPASPASPACPTPTPTPTGPRASSQAP